MILLHCCPSDPKALFEEFWEDMAGPNWTKERLLRFFARKMQMNNAEPDEKLFKDINMDTLDTHDDELQPDEGPHALELPTLEERDGSYRL